VLLGATGNVSGSAIRSLKQGCINASYSEKAYKTAENIVKQLNGPKLLAAIKEAYYKGLQTKTDLTKAKNLLLV
jgi:hypothetical protein